MKTTNIIAVIFRNLRTVCQICQTNFEDIDEQCDQGLHCLSFPMHLLEASCYNKTTHNVPILGCNSQVLGVQKLRIFTVSFQFTLVLFEPRCEKTGLRGFLPGPTQIRLYSHRRWLEACNFVFRK